MREMTNLSWGPPERPQCSSESLRRQTGSHLEVPGISYARSPPLTSKLRTFPEEMRNRFRRRPAPTAVRVLFRPNTTLIGVKAQMVPTAEASQMDTTTANEAKLIWVDRRSLSQDRVRGRLRQSSGHEEFVDPGAFCPQRWERGI